MRAVAWILILAAALPAFAQKADNKQAVLSELWQRRVLSPDKDEYTTADLLLLSRMHRSEAEDACGYLKAKYRGLRGLAVVWRDPETRQTHLRLTKDGFDKYLFLRSQAALAYFQERDVGYKWAFEIKDLDGQPLFDAAGLLTDAGQTVYNRLLNDREAHWRMPDGQILGNRAPPKDAQPEPPPVMAAPARQPSVTQAPPDAQPQPDNSQGQPNQQPAVGTAPAPATTPAGQDDD